MIKNQISESLLKNRLGLFSETGEVDVERTANFMEISRKQLAEIFGLTVDQLRPDRMSPKTKDKIGELATAFEFVAETFEGNVEKTKYWINTPNLNFGGAAPRDLILRGRHRKVLSFILSANKR
ncbi:MAG: MbcA/ParS/Xre antitoxin family protein [Bdellovibrionaceae bacterium]|nr:MbcA/ParS/Xre antitoxin family protein [Pseudobdellovibrionaceae bacterium]